MKDILILPCEMIAKIASYVSYKDVNSLSRTSKTVRAKLNAYKNMVPKVPVHIHIETQPEKIELSYRGASRLVRKVILTGADVSTDLLTEEEMPNRILHFYKKCQGGRNKEIKQSFAQGRLHGLSMHLRLLQTIASITTMNLCGDHDSLDEIVRLVNLEEHSRVTTLRVRSSTITMHQLNFISTCNPSHLIIDSPTGPLPNDFYKLPVVRKLSVLRCYFSNEFIVHDLCSLSAPAIKIFGCTNITFDDVKEFFKQWLASKREIIDVQLQMGDTVRADQWGAMFEEETEDPEKLVDGWDGIPLFNNPWKLRRPSDGQSLFCRLYSDNTIHLTKYSN